MSQAMFLLLLLYLALNISVPVDTKCICKCASDSINKCEDSSGSMKCCNSGESSTSEFDQSSEEKNCNQNSEEAATPSTTQMTTSIVSIHHIFAFVQ